MRKLILLASLALLPVRFFASDYYVGPSTSGSANCSSPTNLCLFATAAALVSAGDRILMADGTYTGANSMINPPDGKNGTSGNPITVSAINDGEVLIDGQVARTPIHLENNDYWVIEGMNAKNGADDVVDFGPGASNNIIRRVCAWDAEPTGNTAVMWNYDSTATDNLLEDVCAFGSGRKMIANGQSGDSRFTVRRAFALWTKSNDAIGAGVIENTYNSYHGLYENIIATADEDPASSTPSQTNGILANGHFGTGPVTSEQICSNSSYLGSIGYSLSTQSLPPFQTSVLDMSQYVDCNTLRNVVVYAEDGRGRVNLSDVTSGEDYPGPNGVQTYANGTEIGSGSSSIGGSWTVTNRSTGAAVGDVPNIWNGGGSSGARVCYRYINGTLTSTPLWPWPMNQRIIDAMTDAGRTPIDVTATLEGIFGTIPDECRDDVSDPPGTITVQGPSSGVKCVSGSTCTITWTSAGITGSVDLKYLVGGQEYSIASVAYDSSPYVWTVNAPASTVAQIRIEQGAVGDDSDTFTILGTRVPFR